MTEQDDGCVTVCDDLSRRVTEVVRHLGIREYVGNVYSDGKITLDGRFTADQLVAIATAMQFLKFTADKSGTSKEPF